MDLIILALIAGFIIYRLYTTLGEKTGYKGDKKDTPPNVINFSTKQSAEPIKNKDTSDIETEEIPVKIRPIIQKIIKLNPDFSLKEFREGATIAFEAILEAYSSGDAKTLKDLLSLNLYKAFKTAIEKRKDLGHTLENTLVRVEDVIVEGANIIENKIQIHVRYVTEQVPVLKDQNGEILEGNPNQIDQVIDTWTFERPIRTRNPNWVLVSTKK